MLEASNVRKYFGGVRALNGASIELGGDEIVGLVGPNGSGKTTMLNVLSGFVQPDEGRVTFRGTDIAGASPWDISLLGLRRTFQHPGMPMRMASRELLLAGADLPTASTIRGTLFRPRAVRQERRATMERADELLDTLELGHVANLPAAELSGGQQKLLSLGVVLMNEPTALLLDEPTAGVLPSLRVGLIEVLKKVRERGTSLLVIEHDMAFIGALCDRAFVFDKGANVVCCPPAELTSHPEVVEAYLGAPPSHTGGRRRRRELAS